MRHCAESELSWFQSLCCILLNEAANLVIFLMKRLFHSKVVCSSSAGNVVFYWSDMSRCASSIDNLLPDFLYPVRVRYLCEHAAERTLFLNGDYAY